jgi:hypothetical protein
MPINVTLTTRAGALWWGRFKVAPAGASGRLPDDVRLKLIAAGLVTPRLRFAYLRRCDRCGAAVLAAPLTRYCRPCRAAVNRENMRVGLVRFRRLTRLAPEAERSAG